MNLEELGAALRAERERRGLSIEDVANTLKIGGRHLRALEDADLSSLPHVAYTRGFIRAYAGFLGLSQAEFDGVLQELAPQENIAPAQAVYMPAEESGSGAALGKLFSLLIVLIILAGGGYFLWSSGLLQKGVALVSGTSGDAPHVAKPSGLPDPAEPPVPAPAPKAAPERKESAPEAKPSAAAPTPAPAPQAAAPEG
ncbi:helix-turn-helix domain-containing protein, partial [uncultured Desulfovibrio sp.]